MAPRLTASREDVERFMRYVDVLPSGCWFWTGGRSRGAGNSKWYGSFRLNGTTVRAHRFSCDVIAGRELPPGWHRDHGCEFSLCVNPDCVEFVSSEVNQHRKTARNGRGRRADVLRAVFDGWEARNER